MKIKDIPIENQPRERFLKKGTQALSDAELLAVILQKGTRNENVVDLSNKLLKNGIDNLSMMSLTELQKINGIGIAKAMQIIAIFELNNRNKQNNISNKVSCAEDVYYLMEFLKNKKKEYFYGLYLDTRNNVIEKPELITVGILDASIIHPREIFKQAIKKSAKSIILVHNHPSGETSPSQEDIEITTRLKKAGELLDVTLLDHVIIGNGFYSFKEKRMLITV